MINNDEYIQSSRMMLFHDGHPFFISGTAIKSRPIGPSGPNNFASAR
jgi:hypothetical protein